MRRHQMRSSKPMPRTEERHQAELTHSEDAEEDVARGGLSSHAKAKLRRWTREK